MDIYTLGPVAFALDLAYRFTQFLSSVIEPVAGAQATVLAILLLTVLVRLVLVPVGVSQVRAQRMRERLAPRLGELKRLHAKNPERMQRETMGLYSAEGASPLAGCLPLLLQAPVLSIVYGLFVLPTINGHANGLLTQTLLGSPLGTSLVSTLGSGGLSLVLLVPALLVAYICVVVLLSRRLSLAAMPTIAPTVTPPAAGMPAGTPAMPPAVMRALSWLPLVSVVFATIVPLAATFYLAVTMTWTLVERTVLRRLLARR